MSYFWRLVLVFYLFVFVTTIVSILADALTSGSIFGDMPRLLLLVWEVFSTVVIVVALYKLSFGLAFYGAKLWIFLFANVLLNRSVLFLTGNIVDFSYFGEGEVESGAIVYLVVFTFFEVAAISSPLFGYSSQKGKSV